MTTNDCGQNAGQASITSVQSRKDGYRTEPPVAYSGALSGFNIQQIAAQQKAQDYIDHAINNGLARPAVPSHVEQLQCQITALRHENNDLRDMIALLRMQMRADAAPAAPTPDAKSFPLRALTAGTPRIGLVVSND